MKKKGRISTFDEKLRKRWLFATAINWVGWPLFIGSSFTLYFLFKGIPIFLLWEIQDFQELLLLVPLGLIQMGIISYYAYKKNGTKYLTFCLIVGPLLFLNNIIKELKDGSVESPVWLVCTGVEVAMYLWWYVLSIGLLKLNDKIQAQTSIKLLKKQALPKEKRKPVGAKLC